MDFILGFSMYVLMKLKYFSFVVKYRRGKENVDSYSFYPSDLTKRYIYMYIFVSKFGEVFVYRTLVKGNSLLSNCYKTKKASKVTSLMESC